MFRDARITESSGAAASARRGDVLFTHNDSGDSARFFAIDRDGCTIGTFSAPGVQATDWEDMARGPGPSLYLGDIGDNDSQRADIAVHRFPEPALAGATCSSPLEQSVTPTTYRFRYADGPHDAETLLVAPRTGRIYVVTKNFSSVTAWLYAAPPHPRTDAVNVLRRVARVPLFAPTGGDIAPDGREVALRGYAQIEVWRISGGDLAGAFERAPVFRVAAPDAGLQGEGLAYTRDGRALVTTSEGVHAPVYRISLPR